MKLEILSFAWNLFKSESVVSVTTMTKIWEITVLKDHSPLISSLKPSTVSIVYLEDEKEKEKDFAIWGWVLEVSDNWVKILVDMLVWVEDIDLEKAEKAREEAIALMEKYKDSKDKVDMEKFIEAEDMLLKYIAKLKLSYLNK